MSLSGSIYRCCHGYLTILDTLKSRTILSLPPQMGWQVGRVLHFFSAFWPLAGTNHNFFPFLTSLERLLHYVHPYSENCSLIASVSSP